MSEQLAIMDEQTGYELNELIPNPMSEEWTLRSILVKPEAVRPGKSTLANSFIEELTLPTHHRLHPWLDDLREYARMLSGETKITHQKQNHFIAAGLLASSQALICDICIEATEKRAAYQHELSAVR